LTIPRECVRGNEGRERERVLVCVRARARAWNGEDERERERGGGGTEGQRRGSCRRGVGEELRDRERERV